MQTVSMEEEEEEGGTREASGCHSGQDPSRFGRSSFSFFFSFTWNFLIYQLINVTSPTGIKRTLSADLFVFFGFLTEHTRSHFD